MKFTHNELCTIGERYLRVTLGCKVTAKELTAFTKHGEIPDVLGFTTDNSYLLECKASRSDFLSDKKKLFRKYPDRGMGEFRYYVCPTGLIDRKELPEKWGLIYVNARGKCRMVYGYNPKHSMAYDKHMRYNQRKKAYKFEYCMQSERAMLFSMARRMVFNGMVFNGEWKYKEKA